MTSMANLRLSRGMELRTKSHGWAFEVTGVSEERVVGTGPHGTLGVDRAELERDIRAGRVEIERWP